MNLHSLVADTKIAIANTLNPFFTTGDTKFLQGLSITFPVCAIYYDIRQLESVSGSTTPAIGIVGQRSEITKYKCISNGIPGIVRRVLSKRSVYVKVVNQYPIKNAAGVDDEPRFVADEVWSLLAMVCNTQVAAFQANGIDFARMDDQPLDASTQKDVVLLGAIEFQVSVFSQIQ